MKSFQYMGCSNETDWVNILAVIKAYASHITYYSRAMFFIAYIFKGQVRVSYNFTRPAGQVQY